MARDLKYGQVEVEHGDFENDELVVVFRARDKHLPSLLQAYHTLCRADGSPRYHLERIEETFDAVATLHHNHPELVRQPTSESHRVRTQS